MSFKTWSAAQDATGNNPAVDADGKARPASPFGAADRWVNIRNVADGEKELPLRPPAVSKAIKVNDTSA